MQNNIRTDETKANEKSSLFNSTFAVELKAKRPTSRNPYKARMAFLSKALKENTGKGDGNNA